MHITLIAHVALLGLSSLVASVPITPITNARDPRLNSGFIGPSDLVSPNLVTPASLPSVNELLRAASRTPPARRPKGSLSGERGDPVGKYFHETVFDPHYDGRFAVERVPYAARREVLSRLVKAYLRTMHDFKAETWIMHGSLLGWWWNKRILPWDSDLDVMVSANAMQKLVAHNMTVHRFHDDLSGTSTDYLLEINPNYVNPSTDDRLNWIDGRWVDMVSGLYIDITTFYDEVVPGVSRSKDNHIYVTDDIYPLQHSQFEGVPCMVPADPKALLLEEYGLDSIRAQQFQTHEFNQEVMDWVPLPLFVLQ